MTEQMKRLADEPGDLETFYRLAMGFHKVLAGCSGNDSLEEVVGELVDVSGHPLWTLINRKILEARESRRTQIVEHEAIITAIQRGDGPTAAEALRTHLVHLTDSALT